MKTVRVVHYAINGRGMGHLVRQLAIARWMRRYAAVLGVKLEHWVLTSSEADTLARREGMLSLKIPSKSMMRDAGVEPARYLAIARAWVLQTLVGLQPDLLVVDTFPAGSFGELLAALELVPQRALIARPVRAEVGEQDAWRSLLPLYGRVIVPDEGGVGPILIREPEELPDRATARRALGVPEGARAVWVSLGGGGDPVAPSVLPRLVDALRARGWYVVVAAGPLYQGEERRGEGIVWLDRYVGVEVLPGVDAAVSAGGYNAWHELMMVGVPTVFLPQPRIADDQDGRADRAVAAGVALRARSLEEVPDLLERLLALRAPRDRALVPSGGARRAAAELLSMVLPPADVRMAERAFPVSLLAHPAARALDPRRLVEVVRWLSGEAPSRWAARRADGLELVDRGLLSGAVPKDPPRGAPVEAFLALAEQVPAEAAVDVLGALVRRWPGASGPELLAACARLLPAFARFDDWPGAVALLRALPQQRTWALSACADALGGWLDGERDLFDAQRALVRTSAAGRRSLAETLHLLAQGGPRPEEGLLLSWRSAVLAGIAAGRPEVGPSSVHIDITNGCNAACVTCWDHSPLLSEVRPAAWKRRRLPLERFEAIVAQLDALGSVRHVVLSGMGEPLTHPDVYTMMAAIKRRGWQLTLISNLVAADVDRLAATGVDHLLAGVQGVTPTSYTAFHPGWTERHFFDMCAVLRRLGRTTTRVRHVQVINRDTAPEVVEMVRFGRLFRADRVNYKLASLRGGTEGCAMTEDQRGWLLSDGIPAARALAGALGVRTNLDLFERQVASGGRSTAPMAEIGCFMGYVFTRVTVDEDVLFCCNTEVGVGSLREGSFRDLWWGERWQALRAHVAGGRFFRGCDQCGKLEQNVKWGELVAAGEVDDQGLIGVTA